MLFGKIIADCCDVKNTNILCRKIKCSCMLMKVVSLCFKRSDNMYLSTYPVNPVFALHIANATI